jgi:hypothetical protein
MPEIEGHLWLESTPGMYEAVEANEHLFLETIEDEANREVARDILDRNRNEANPETKKTIFNLLTDLAGFTADDSRFGRETLRADGICIRGFNFNEGANYDKYTEEYLWFLAKLGFGVDASFTDFEKYNKSTSDDARPNTWHVEGEINSLDVTRNIYTYTLNGWPIGSDFGN